MRSQESTLESEGQDGLLNEDNLSYIHVYAETDKKTNNLIGKAGKEQD